MFGLSMEPEAQKTEIINLSKMTQIKVPSPVFLLPFQEACLVHQKLLRGKWALVIDAKLGFFFFLHKREELSQMPFANLYTYFLMGTI